MCVSVWCIVTAAQYVALLLLLQVGFETACPLLLVLYPRVVALALLVLTEHQSIGCVAWVWGPCGSRAGVACLLIMQL